MQLSSFTWWCTCQTTKRKTAWPRKVLDSEKRAIPDTSRVEDDRMCNRIQRMCNRSHKLISRTHLRTCKSWRARRTDRPDWPGRALLSRRADLARNPLSALVSGKTLGSWRTRWSRRSGFTRLSLLRPKSVTSLRLFSPARALDTRVSLGTRRFVPRTDEGSTRRERKRRKEAQRRTRRRRAVYGLLGERVRVAEQRKEVHKRTRENER